MAFSKIVIQSPDLLFLSIKADFPKVQHLVALVPNISRATSEGLTALHHSIFESQEPIVKYLINKGADVNAVDLTGWSPLHYAAFYCQYEISRFLVEHGAAIYSQSIEGNVINCYKPNAASTFQYNQCHDYIKEMQLTLGVCNDAKVYAVFDFCPEEDSMENYSGDELSFTEGEELIILKRGERKNESTENYKIGDSYNKWWYAKNRLGECGWVPRNYLGIGGF